VVFRDGHMLVILDEETIARKSGRKRYGVPGNTGSRQTVTVSVTLESEAKHQKRDSTAAERMRRKRARGLITRISGVLV
jgi:hypothetical protein